MVKKHFEIIVEKGECVGYQHFSFSHNVFFTSTHKYNLATFYPFSAIQFGQV